MTIHITSPQSISVWCVLIISPLKLTVEGACVLLDLGKAE